jgi:hypothetical protein
MSKNTNSNRSKTNSPFSLLELLKSHRGFSTDASVYQEIGNALVAQKYNLTLLPITSDGHNALSKHNLKIKIISTLARRIILINPPEHLIVVQIRPNFEIREVFNGPGDFVWNEAKVLTNNHRLITLSRLRKLMDRVPNPDLSPKRALKHFFT